jgi:hypothetical protein
MIDRKRPLLTMATALGDVPEFWRQVIEPRIMRPADTSCWVWTGAHDSDGEPVVNFTNPETKLRNTRRLKRSVADMFWEIKRHYDIVHKCGNLSCLNPAHIGVTAQHWTQR